MRISIYKREGRKGVRWYLDYHWGKDRNGRPKRWRYPVADTKAAAEEIKARIQVQVAEGTFKGPKSIKDKNDGQAVWTFARLCEEWFCLRESSIRPATRAHYSTILKALRCEFGERFENKKFKGPSTDIREITCRDCERVIARKRAQSSSPVRGNRWLTVLRSVFKAAVRWELLEHDPTGGLAKEKEPLRQEVILSPADLGQILARCEGWLRPIVLTAYHTGPRRGDLLGEGPQYGGGRALMWEDVDLENRVITYRDTKEKNPRAVPINDDLLVALRDLPSRFQGREVFLDDRRRPVKPDRAYRRFKAAAVAAKVPDAGRLRFHDLRHTCGTSLIEREVAIHDVKAILGHHSVQMTERYLHAKQERLRAAVEKLSGTTVAQIETSPDNAGQHK